MESAHFFNNKPVVVAMGVCGCGKSTIAKKIASQLQLPFFEGDDFHPASNIEKMSNGIGLTDEDRWPWLDALGEAIRIKNNDNSGVILSCSALTRAYRERLSTSSGVPILYIYLHGSRETLLKRMNSRANHYMPSSLLDGQLDTLEIPEDDEIAFTVSIEKSISEIVKESILKINSMRSLD
ncbi:gluconokinase [uncultured Cocleimonas sp.]|uniref:gluconokinase n=1 Tax=uncultured Cocleimonas sp. TaxID=1051587 RepID=UPI0026067A57|nr:gluconokinase [uncultured Cocleimonas sp.]